MGSTSRYRFGSGPEIVKEYPGEIVTPARHGKRGEMVLSRDELRDLLEYSCSLPTGTYEGKRWRCNVQAYRSGPRREAEWIIAEYVPDSRPDQIGILWYWALDENREPHRGDL